MAEASYLEVLEAIPNGRLSFDDALQIYDGPLRAVSLFAAAFHLYLHCFLLLSLLLIRKREVSDAGKGFGFRGNGKEKTPPKVREILKFSRQNKLTSWKIFQGTASMLSTLCALLGLTLEFLDAAPLLISAIGIEFPYTRCVELYYGPTYE